MYQFAVVVLKENTVNERPVLTKIPIATSRQPRKKESSFVLFRYLLLRQSYIFQGFMECCSRIGQNMNKLCH